MRRWFNDDDGAVAALVVVVLLVVVLVEVGVLVLLVVVVSIVDEFFRLFFSWRFAMFAAKYSSNFLGLGLDLISSSHCSHV